MAHMSDRSKRIILALVVLGAAIWVTTDRIARFGSLEPGIDQAASALLVANLRHSERVLPVVAGHPSYRDRLEGDPNSLLAVIARPMIGAPVLSFTVVGSMIAVLLSFVTGTDYRGYVLSSLLIAGLNIVLVGLLGWIAGRRSSPGNPHRPLVLALFCIAAYVSIPYAGYFAPWGAHNYGVAGLLAASAATTAWLAPSKPPLGRPGLLVLLVWQAIALYSHWTNLLVLPAATLLSLCARGVSDDERRFQSCFGYIAGLGFVLLPGFVVIAYAAFQGVSSTQWAALTTQGSLSCILANALARAQTWISTATDAISGVGLAVALLGVALFWLRDRIVVPGAFVAVHLLVWVAIPGFSWNGSQTSLRTVNYLLPFLALGVGRTLLWILEAICDVCLRTRSGFPVAIAAGATILCGMGLQSGRLFGGLTTQLGSAFHAEYLLDQGNIERGGVILGAVVPDGATLMAWTDVERIAYGVYLPRLDLERGVAVQSYLRHLRAGDLVQWISRRNLQVPEVPFYAMVPVSVPERDLEDGLGALFPEAYWGHIRVRIVAFLPSRAPWFGVLSLLEVDVQ